jgi:hypothetical protein
VVEVEPDPADAAAALTAVDDYYAEVAAGNWDVVRSAHVEYNASNLESAIAFGATFEYSCEPPTYRIGEPQIIQTRCVETMHDDFYGPGGLALTGTVVYSVADPLEVRAGFGCPWSGDPAERAFYDYIDDFQTWLDAEGRWIPGMVRIPGGDPGYMPCSPYPFDVVPTEEAVAQAREEMVAFVAASPDWPRSD